jgi:nicotinic acid mononucleotide adenylyltransferase
MERSRSRSRSIERSRSRERDNFESIPLISNSPRSSVRERRTTQKYRPEHISPRSSVRERRTTQKYQSEHISPSSSNAIQTKSGLNIPDTTINNNMSLSSSHGEKETNDGKYKMVFTIGRMNPPTSGHLKLIFELMTLARENNLDNIGIVLSPSEDNKNPLSCYRKKQYILEMVSSMSDIKTNIICKETGFPMSNIYELLNESGVDNNSKMLLIIGEDRLNAFNWLKKYYPNLEIRALDRPEGAMSATTIRGYVSTDDNNSKNAFNKAYSGILQQDVIDDLYNEVASGLSKYSKTAPSSSKKSKIQGGRKPRQTKRKRVKNSKKRISSRY